MKGYLSRLSAKVAGIAQFLRPRIPSRYEGQAGAESRLDTTVETTFEPRREPVLEGSQRSSPDDTAVRTIESPRVIREDVKPQLPTRRPFRSGPPEAVREAVKPEAGMHRPFRSDPAGSLKPSQGPLPAADRPPDGHRDRHRKIRPQTEDPRPRATIKRPVGASQPAAAPARSPDKPAPSDPGRPQPFRISNPNRERAATIVPLPAESTSSRITGTTKTPQKTVTRPLSSDVPIPDGGDGNRAREFESDPPLSAPPVQEIARSLPPEDRGPIIEVRINRIELSAAAEPLPGRKRSRSSRAVKEIPSLAEYLGHREF